MSTNADTQCHILLCVAGLTPQIVTETLYVLTQQRQERVDEIRVITTSDGWDRMTRALLHPEDGQFFAFCHDYGIDPSSIMFDKNRIALLQTPDGRTLDDIRSVHDNGHAANQICEIVRELTQDPQTRLHASVAGGRKTMSIYLTAAMQLFGRVQDRLSHVLVNEYFEMHPDFYYIPPMPRLLEIQNRQREIIGQLSTVEASIELADIPFIRFRGVLSDWIQQSGSTYGAMVQRAQEDLDLLGAAHTLRINSRTRTVLVANRRLQLTERELFIYALLAYFRQQGRGEAGFVTLDEITRADLDTVFRRITAARGDERGLDDVDLVARFQFLDKLAERISSTHPIDRKDVQNTVEQVISRIKKKREKEWVPDRYLITSSGERGALRYGLAVDPQWINWEDIESV